MLNDSLHVLKIMVREREREIKRVGETGLGGGYGEREREGKREDS